MSNPSQVLKPTSRTISTAELHDRLSDPDVTIVDVRPIAAYNGWRLQGEVRGGHIPGATVFPSAWLRSVDETEIRRLLLDKGITPDRTVVVYGDGAGDAAALEARLAGLGHTDVLRYDAGFPPGPPMSACRSSACQTTTSWSMPEWVRQLVAGERPDTYNGRPFPAVPRQLRSSRGVRGRPPPRRPLPRHQLAGVPEDWNRRSPAELEATLTALGISPRHDGRPLRPRHLGNPNEKWPGRRAGQISATRAAAILKYAGVEDVRLLDGGYDRWVTAGYPLETDRPHSGRRSRAWRLIPQRPDYIVDIDDAKEILADREGAALVSVRTWKEHIGKVSGYNYIEPAGRIAGDVWGNCGTDAYHMQHYRSIDNTMRAYPEIAANWQEAGITR